MVAGELTRTIAPLRLLEREAELAALEAMLDAARVGDGRLVVVEGSAGIGKTRLLAEARALAQAAEFEVLSARGGELEGEFAFGIVRQLFEAPLAAATPELRAELLAGAAELSASLFASAPTSASREGVESSFAMLHGLYWLTANFASRTPDASCRRRPALGRRAVAALASLLVPPPRRSAGPPSSRHASSRAGQSPRAGRGTPRRFRRRRDAARRFGPGVGGGACARAARRRACSGVRRRTRDWLGREPALPGRTAGRSLAARSRADRRARAAGPRAGSASGLVWRLDAPRTSPDGVDRPLAGGGDPR